MLEEFSLEMHYESPQRERSTLGRLSLLYLIQRLVNNLEAHSDLSRDALTVVVSEAFTQAFAPERPAPEGLAADHLTETPPFLLGGVAPGLALEIDEEGEPLRMETITYEQSEALRTHLNRALKVVADDPAEFDSPLLLGPDGDL